MVPGEPHQEGTAVAETAVAVAASLDIAHFQSHPLKNRGCLKDHNEALKYFRFLLIGDIKTFDLSAHELTQKVYELPFDESVDVRKVYHKEKSPKFWFDMTDSGLKQWNWQQMVSHLYEESSKYVVQGPERRSSGILKCSVEHRADSYDHKCQVQVGHDRQIITYF